ncbi:MAG: TonB-dependent receptor plug domain-containing protein [Bacteroidaceae bacterium]|nr:TonB-dependent receptor plug domain-containing protein [Bacteroidaceae bacterium]
MKRIIIMSLAGLIAGSAAAQNQQETSDSMRMERIQELVVTAVRAKKNAPFAVTEIKEKQLQEHSRTGRELPLLLARTPGIMAWGENGLGTGTTYMRIRGAGDSRINVTLDGVPLNSPEDQCVFWANMNSYAALLGSVQVQRGVGTSTNGDGAFGGSIALSMAEPSLTPNGEVNFSYGSYNTMNYGVRASTGLLWKHLVIDGAWHQTQADGFLHGTDGRSGSYYGGITWMPNERFTLRYKNVGNYEHTGQAWNGVTAGDNDLSIMDGTYGEATGIKTYRDLYERGLGKFNSLYEKLAYDEDGNFARDAEGNYLTERYTMRDGSFWPRTTDNFKQNHNILSMAWDINQHWSTTATLHYTYGYGYYEEFRPDNKLPKKFGLNYFKDDGKEKKSDVVRQKGLKQHTYGLLWNANYKDRHWDVIGGLALQRFNGNHFGYITYIKDEAIAGEVLNDGRYTYYDSDATKDDHSLFVKASYNIGAGWSAWGDLQYRHVGYRTDGYNDKFVKQDDGTYDKHWLDINKHYHFVNPKAGISWHHGGHMAYASHAIANREPERNNFTDNGHYPAPKAERVFDTEAGYSYTAKNWHAGINLYHMYYNNQFVQTGMESDIGEKLTTNIKKSYRMGIELTAGVDITKWLSLEGNAALSRNRILDFDEEASVYWEDDWQTIHYDNSTLAFSPSVLLNGFLNFHLKGIEATWHTNFVSRQYLDNTENKDRSLPSYSTSNLSLSYTLPCKRWAGLREVIFGSTLTNLFGRRYAANGWVYSTICEGYGHPDDNRYYQIGFIPAAGFTAMGSVTLRF